MMTFNILYKSSSEIRELIIDTISSGDFGYKHDIIAYSARFFFHNHSNYEDTDGYNINARRIMEETFEKHFNDLRDQQIIGREHRVWIVKKDIREFPTLRGDYGAH